MKFLSSLTVLSAVILVGALWVNFISAEEKIDINSASLEDLIKIIHIGEARARELISLRPFSSLDDLDRIKGIGTSRIEDIKKQGLAWVNGAENSSPPTEKSHETSPSGLAAVGEQMPENPSLPLLIPIVIAFLSGIIILFLKRKTNSATIKTYERT